MQLHRLITKVGGATTTANFCCQIITEQFYKVQLTQKHVESNHAGQNGRLYTWFTCQWLQSRPKRVCIWTPVFHRIQRGRLHLAGKRRRCSSIGAFMRLRSVSVVTSLQNSADLSSALMLYNVLMVMTASDRPSAAGSDFLCKHTHPS